MAAGNPAADYHFAGVVLALIETTRVISSTNDTEQDCKTD
jgi:hypothetical protein